MKNSGIKILLPFLAVAVGGCAKGASTASVNSAFVMTGSSSSQTVATHRKPGLLGMLLPSASALAPSSMQDSSGTTVTLSSAWVVIEQIEFKEDEVSEASEVEGAEVEFDGPYVVNLLATTPQLLDTKSIPALAYKRIKMKLHKATTLPAAAPSQLAGNSIYLSGHVGANAFSYQADDTTHFDISGPSPILPSSGADLLVAINLANVVRQVNLSTLPNNAVINSTNRFAGSNLCPAIDSRANDIYTCFRKALQTHANFGKDSHHGGDFDAEGGRVK